MEKKKIIFISGIDCSGKSTLAKKLSELLTIEIKHFDKPASKEDGRMQYYSFIEENKNTCQNIICDRFHEGENVYAPIYRGYDAYDYLDDFETKLLEHFDVKHIHMTANKEEIVKRFRERGEDFVSITEIDFILNNYKEYINKTKLETIIIDNSNLSTTTTLLKALAFIGGIQHENI